MKKLIMILVCMMSIVSCSQITTSKSELTGLKTTADNLADAYIVCVKNNSLSNAAKNVVDVAAVVNLASSVCQAQLDQYKNAQEEYLGAQVMLTGKPLQQSLDALKQRAETEVGEAILAAADSAPATAGTGAGIAAGTAAAAATRAAPAAPPPAGGWSADQRVYLDCMEDQARKYAGLNESASVIADVAQSRCQSYATGAGSAALEQEGRATVMGMVLDAKLQGPGKAGGPSNN